MTTPLYHWEMVKNGVLYALGHITQDLAATTRSVGPAMSQDDATKVCLQLVGIVARLNSLQRDLNSSN